MLPLLYKRDVYGQVRTWAVHIHGASYYVMHGLQFGEKVKSETIVAQPKNLGRANETTAEEQALFEAESLWKKQQEQKGYVINIEDIDNVQFNPPMLANTYKGQYKSSMAYIQPKLDGIRCNFSYNKLTQKAEAISRRNKPFFSVGHIANILTPILSLYPTVHLDGELYNHDMWNDFNGIVSIVRKQKLSAVDLAEAKRLIRYNVYDLWDDANPFMTFEERFSLAHELLVGESFIDLVDTRDIISTRDIDDYFNEFISRGYEGAIIRTNGPYQHKRCDNLLKYKRFIEQEFTVLSICEGRAGGKAEFAEIQLPNNKTCKATLAFSDLECIDILQNAYAYIGQKASVQFFGWTPDGKLRFPVLKAFRNYE